MSTLKPASTAGAEEDDKPLGWRDLPKVVNIKDFAQMVGGEAEQIGGSLRGGTGVVWAVAVRPHLGLLLATCSQPPQLPARGGDLRLRDGHSAGHDQCAPSE